VRHVGHAGKMLKGKNVVSTARILEITVMWLTPFSKRNVAYLWFGVRSRASVTKTAVSSMRVVSGCSGNAKARREFGRVVIPSGSRRR